MKRLIKNATWGMVWICAACATAVAAPPESASTEGIKGHFTKPSKDLTLTFIGRGRIAEVLVKEGDKVNPEDVLVRQDDEAEREELARVKAEAEADIYIRHANMVLKQRRVELDELKEAGVPFAVSALEYRRAQLEVEVASLSKELKLFEKAQNQRKAKELEIRIDRMKLRSPIAGKVEEIFVGEGESAEPGQQVVRVVSTDPLWIDLLVNLDMTRGLKVGGAARVEFPDADTPPTIGTITFIAAVAHSRLRAVRVEIPNKRLDPAGEPVVVHFLEQNRRAKRTSEKPLSNVTGKAVSNKTEKE